MADDTRTDSEQSGNDDAVRSGDDDADQSDGLDRSDAVEHSTTQRIDPGAFDHVKSRLDNGFDRGVSAFVRDDDGDLLLVCQDGRWALPGGEVGDGAANEESLRNIVESQTGLEITVGDLLAVTDATMTDGERETGISFATYSAEVPAGGSLPAEIEARGESVTAVEWHDELPAATIDRQLLVELRSERTD